MWETKRFKCKSTLTELNDPFGDNFRTTNRFIVDKWYDGSYKIWSEDPIKNQERYKINNGWNEYSAIDEYGEQRFLTRSYFRAIFFSDAELRNEIIDEIISDKTSEPEQN